MKEKTLKSKLGKFKSVQDKNGDIIYYSRVNNKRYVKVINDGVKAIALPMRVYFEIDGVELLEVAFHAKTIKSLVEFLEG